MKTITIEIQISENNTTTIGDTIQEQIEFHKKQRELADRLTRERASELFKLRDTILEQLNKEVGADVWTYENTNRYYPNIEIKPFERSIAVSIGFRDGVYKNTPYNDWDIYFSTPLKDKVTFGSIEYRMPDLEKIEMILVPTNRKEHKTEGFMWHHVIKDLSEVHAHLNNDYITYFTNKK